MTPLLGLIACVVFVWVAFAIAMVAHLRRHALPLVPHYDPLDSGDDDL